MGDNLKSRPLSPLAGKLWPRPHTSVIPACAFQKMLVRIWTRPPHMVRKISAGIVAQMRPRPAGQLRHGPVTQVLTAFLGAFRRVQRLVPRIPNGTGNPIPGGAATTPISGTRARPALGKPARPGVERSQVHRKVSGRRALHALHSGIDDAPDCALAANGYLGVNAGDDDANKRPE